MSFYEFKELFNKFAEAYDSAERVRDYEKGGEAIESFDGDVKRWALRMKSVTSVAIDICTFMDPGFKSRFINVITRLQPKDVPHTIKLIVDEVNRLSDPKSMIKQLEQQAYDAYNAREQAKQQSRHAKEAWFNASRQLNEYKQHNPLAVDSIEKEEITI